MKWRKTCFGRNFDEGPYQDAQPGKRNDDPFNSEEISDILRRHEHQWELDGPIEKIAHHAYHSKPSAAVRR